MLFVQKGQSIHIVLQKALSIFGDIIITKASLGK